MNVIHSAVWVAVLLGVAAALSDIKTRQIPNVLTFGGIVIGILIQSSVGFVDAGFRGAAYGFLAALGGMAVCAIMPVVGFAKGELGGGDVKLFAAIGALCGPGLGFDAEACTFFVTTAFVLPWRLVKYGAVSTIATNFRITLGNFGLKSDAKRSHVLVNLPPIILAPSILAGLCLAIARRMVGS